MDLGHYTATAGAILGRSDVRCDEKVVLMVGGGTSMRVISTTLIIAATVALASGAFAQDESGVRPHMVHVEGNALQGVRGFDISATEITFNHWDECVRAGGCQSNRRPDDKGMGRGARPVIHVSWYDAQEYVRWLSSATGEHYRLPTEGEWERAAGAFPTERRRHMREPTGDYAWTAFNAGGVTHPVATKQANANGVYDAWGNVWEWVDDCFTPRCTRRVLRGGSYNYTPRQLRSTTRNANDPHGRYDVVGFRVVRDAAS